MPRRIIEKESFIWQDENRSRLNYQNLFDQNQERQGEEDVAAEPVVDIEEVLRKRSLEEEKRLAVVQNEAYEKGLREGRQEGYDRSRSEMEHMTVMLERAIREAHEAWKQQQELLSPGLLNLAFEMAEAIIGIPVDNPELKERLEQELIPLVDKLERVSQPVLWVASEDYEYIEHLIEKYADKSGIMLRVGNNCKPGEYQLETNEKKVQRDYKAMLNDFRESLMLPPSNS